MQIGRWCKKNFNILSDDCGFKTEAGIILIACFGDFKSTWKNQVGFGWRVYGCGPFLNCLFLGKSPTHSHQGRLLCCCCYHEDKHSQITFLLSVLRGIKVAPYLSFLEGMGMVG